MFFAALLMSLHGFGAENYPNEVANWILLRTRNPWSPFGYQSHGATSVEEYRSELRWRAKRITAGIANVKQSEERAEAERRARKTQRERSAKDRAADKGARYQGKIRFQRKPPYRLEVIGTASIAEACIGHDTVERCAA